MNWYYVEAGQQAGPVDDARLEELSRSGKILNDTLVWREGMENWRMYGEVKPPGADALAVPPVVVAAGARLAPGEAVCAECGRTFRAEDMIRYGSIHICAECKPVFMQKLAEGAKVNTGALNYAGFWIRVGAKLIDGIIIGVPFIPFIMYFAIRGAAERQPDLGKFQVFQLLFQFAYIAAKIGYEIFFLGKYGATPGKMACGLRVVTPEGGRFGYGRATGRCFAEMLSGMICYIGYIIVGFDDQKRALHDHICNTRVIFK